MRLFIAVNFSAEQKQQIMQLQAQLRSQALRGNFPKPENLHLTLAFLGETPEEKLNCLKKIIDGLKVPAFEIIFNHAGCFKRGRSELWYLGTDIRAGKSETSLSLLQNINRQLVLQIGKEGIYVDKKPFKAHITLAREIKSRKPIELNFAPIRLLIDNISLMKSEHVRGILTYTELHRSFCKKDKNDNNSRSRLV